MPLINRRVGTLAINPTSHPRGLSFLSAASGLVRVGEQTDNAYDDGACVAAAIGITANDGTVQSMRRLTSTRKIEGIEAQVSGGKIVIGTVSDADGPATPAELGTTTW